MSLQIYCVKCRAKTDSDDVRQVVMRNGKDATECICSVCGTKKFRLGETARGSRGLLAFHAGGFRDVKRDAFWGVPFS